jgi:CDP-paratose 2-epimerase
MSNTLKTLNTADPGAPPSSDARPVLITGGAGFVGTNLAARLLAAGRPVRVFDNLSRPGVERNLRWLCERHAERLQIRIGDIRDASAVAEAVAGTSAVFHFAAQVAVTTSLADPRTDLDINLGGAFNLLEALRAQRDPPPLLYTSTNKVYGSLADIPLEPRELRYVPRAPELAARGIAEDRPLDFHSPYGCSKGAADQYVLDYARSFRLPTAVLRMSCIYGHHQCGTEDQGWVAHFVLQALRGQPITLYGDGRQVRDILFAEDLVDALLGLIGKLDRLGGQVFNVGGGPDNTVSLLELLDLIAEIHGHRPEIRFAPARTGDQRYYVSDTRKLSAAIGWQPRHSVGAGVLSMYEWLQIAALSRSGYNPQGVSRQRQG